MKAGIVSIGSVLFTVLALSGCNGQQQFISSVTVTPSPTLESIKVALNFAPNVNAALSGLFTVGDYGDLFISPSSSSSPFQVGLDINTSIFNDQNLIHATPTSYLPDGNPIGLAYPLVQINLPNGIASDFNIYGYADVLHGEWFGLAAMFSVINNIFPDGMSLSQVFNRDSAGNPGIIATLFGPVHNSDGTIKDPGGIALFANLKQLLGKTTPDQQSSSVVASSAAELQAVAPVTYQAEPGVYLSGDHANEFRGNNAKLMKLQSDLVKGFNTLK